MPPGKNQKMADFRILDFINLFIINKLFLKNGSKNRIHQQYRPPPPRVPMKKASAFFMGSPDLPPLRASPCRGGGKIVNNP